MASGIETYNAMFAERRAAAAAAAARAQSQQRLQAENEERMAAHRRRRQERAMEYAAEVQSVGRKIVAEAARDGVPHNALGSTPLHSPQPGDLSAGWVIKSWARSGPNPDYHAVKNPDVWKKGTEINGYILEGDGMVVRPKPVTLYDRDADAAVGHEAEMLGFEFDRRVDWMQETSDYLLAMRMLATFADTHDLDIA